MQPRSSFGEASWHVPENDLDHYRRGFAAPPQGASVETHLTTCPTCQARLCELAHADDQHMDRRLSEVFADILDSVDRPKASRLERLLTKIGVSANVARLLAATPAMRSSWLAALASVLTFTVFATRSGGLEFGVFLVAAPIIPVLAIGAVFGLSCDAMAEMSAVAPMRGSWLLLLRSSAVMAATMVLCGAAAITLPHHGWENAAWILPGLALSAAAAALSTWIQPTTAALSLIAVWFATLTATTGPIARRLHAVDVNVVVARSPAFSFVGQLVAATVTVISLLVLLKRREILDVGSLP